jgi:hypothetical protein
MIGWLMKVEHLMELELVREAEALGEKPPQCHFAHHIVTSNPPTTTKWECFLGNQMHLLAVSSADHPWGVNLLEEVYQYIV